MKKYNIPFLSYLFINLLIIVLMIDYTSIIFDNYLLSLIGCSLLVVVLNIFIKSKIKVIFRFDKTDLVFFVILLFILGYTIVYPDRSFDTFNYHLYIQENPFTDKINMDFFPASEIQTFTYAFSDRVFYLFRYILGYRLGLLFNYLLLIIIYYESKDVIKEIIGKKKELLVSLMAMASVITISIIDIVDSYYVDLLSLATLMIIFKNVMYRPIQNDKPYLLYLFYSFMFGFSFISKISNAFFLGVLFIIFIINNRKKVLSTINIKSILCMIVGLIITISPYMIYTYITTGNPVFPFYNTIFKSDYYPLSNWMDTRFGPKTLKQTLGWPFFIMSYPDWACDISIVEPIWCIGWITSIIYIIYSVVSKIFKKDIDIKYLCLSIIHVVFALVWAKFVLGYTRYGFIVLIISIISTYIMLYKVLINKKYLLSGVLMAFIIYNYAYCFNHYFYGKEEWIYHNYFNYEEKRKDYEYNLNNLLSRGYNIELEDDSVWGVVYANSGLMTLLNDKLPIVNISKGNMTIKNKNIQSEKLDSASHIYTAVDPVDFNNFFDTLQKTEYGIKSIKNVLSYNILKGKNSFLYIFELSKDSKIKNYKMFESSYDLELFNNSDKIFIGLTKDSANAYNEDISLTIIYNDDKNIKNVINDISVSHDGYFYELDTNKNKVISFRHLKDNNIEEGYWFMVLY